MALGRSVKDAILGNAGLTRLSREITGGSLRILAYHDIKDPNVFDQQLYELGRNYQVVGEEVVISWLAGGGSLPPRPVWITFDDGDPSVISNALPVLSNHGVTATAFVCPGLLGTDQPHWWQVVEASIIVGRASPKLAERLGEVPSLQRLKCLPDEQRREIVDALLEVVKDAGVLVGSGQWSDDDLASWVGAGNAVGSHTWDHPCLDMCSMEVQRDQLTRSHEVLTRQLGSSPKTFAWPNGNRAESALGILHELGYEAVVEFDHKLNHGRPNPFRLSRLGMDTGSSIDLFRSVVSGVHPKVSEVGRQLRRRPAGVHARG